PVPFFFSAAGVADFNEDGLLDAAAWAFRGLRFASGQEGGAGFHTEVEAFPVTITGLAVAKVAVADLNRDGIQDLVFAGSLDPSPAGLETALGRGDGSFSAGVKLPSAGLLDNLASVRIGEFDGNGNPDFAVLEPIRGAVLALAGDGAGG